MKHYQSIVALTLSSAATVAASRGSTPEKGVDKQLPNVVFILADDLGIGDVGAYGQRTIRTPYIDSLAANGVQFMQHYSGSTVSAPSRAVLLTGKHTGHSAIRGNFGRRAPDGTVYDYTLPAEEVTLGEQFRAAGYTTAITGKWGMGSESDEGSARNQGFDYFFGYQTHMDAHKAYPKHLWENTTKIQLDGTQYADEMITQRALDFIERSAAGDRPFFLYYTTALPHAELLLPEEEIDPFKGKFKETPYVGNWYGSQPNPRAAFAAMVTRVDRNVGRIVELLRQKGELENTIIVFTSDNGTHQEGGHDPNYFNSNSLYHGIKRDLYEGGIRTPMIISWPGMVRPGSVSYHVSAFWDFMPTFSEIIGVPTPEGIDGISMVPELTGNGKQAEHDYLYWEFHEEGGKQAVLRGNWKLLRLDVKHTQSAPEKVRYELYDLGRDPKELRNVAAQYPDKVKELRGIMDGARTPNEVWNFEIGK